MAQAPAGLIFLSDIFLLPAVTPVVGFNFQDHHAPDLLNLLEWERVGQVGNPCG
jgi:hypothetical protein